MGKHFVFVGVIAIAASRVGAGLIDFNDYSLDPLRGQHRGGVATVLDAGATLQLSGNTWRVLDFSATPIEVTADTVVAFDFRVDRVGEIAGVMLGDRVDRTLGFNLFGTQDWGHPVAGYTDADLGQWRRVVVPVGDELSGRSFDTLTFINDHDSGARDQVSYYRNVYLGAAGAIPEPAALAIFGLAALLCAGGRRNRRRA